MIWRLTVCVRSPVPTRNEKRRTGEKSAFTPDLPRLLSAMLSSRRTSEKRQEELSGETNATRAASLERLSLLSQRATKLR